MSTPGCKRFIVLLLCGSLWSLSAFSGDPHGDAVSRGQYLVEIAGCNDCHTAGFAPSGGAVPVQEWLQGDVLGFRGPWGTTYAPNLRQFFGNLTEEQWVFFAKDMKTRPPMPWWSLNAMSRDDLVAIYRFVKTLGPSDATVPVLSPRENLLAHPLSSGPKRRSRWSVPVEVAGPLQCLFQGVLGGSAQASENRNKNQAHRG